MKVHKRAEICQVRDSPGGEKRELIHVDCVSHVYPDGSVGIHRMCFRVMEREIVALCGANGSGKSTLIEHLNGLLSPSEGRMTVYGRYVDAKQKKELWKEVGIAFQRSEDQLFAPTVLDDVMFGPLNMGMNSKEARLAAEAALQAVGASDVAQKMPNYLSGGQKRLVSIAGILAMRPRIIALDEPTSDLDPVHGRMMEQLIVDLKNTFNISVVIATHDLDLAARIADRICLVKEGSIIAEGSPAEIFYNTPLIEEAGLMKPPIVRIYEEYCKTAGIPPGLTPIRLEELIPVLVPGGSTLRNSG